MKTLLRNLNLSDVPAIAAFANNIKIWNNVRDSFPYPYTENDAKMFIESVQNESPQTTFAIEYEREIAGVTGLIIQSDVYRLNAEVGYWLGEPFWGKGIAVEALKLITHYAFDKLKLARIYASVFEYNKPSMRVLEKAGFNLEGISKKAIIKNGTICDEFRYSKINPALP